MFDEDLVSSNAIRVTVAVSQNPSPGIVQGARSKEVPLYVGVPVNYSLGAVCEISSPSSWTSHPKVTYKKQRLRIVNVYSEAYAFLDELLRSQGL
jgi:hypothetical protein